MRRRCGDRAVTQRVTFAVPGDLAIPTGGYAYDRRVIEELRKLGWQVEALDIGDSFPNPGNAQRGVARYILETTPHDVPLVIDGLAYGVIPEIAEKLAKTHAIVALVHHPLALETGVSVEVAAALHQSERAALSHARKILTTSASTADILLADYGVTTDQITVAEPGHDPVAQVTGSSDGIVRLLTVGSIVPRKGYDVLIAALAQITDLPWHLTIAGDRTRDPQTAAALDAAIAKENLGSRITLHGILSDDELTAAYCGSDIFVQASLFEGYGMAAASAIAHGLPIVATSGGALGKTVGNAGMVVPPGDIPAFANALRRMIANSDERQRHRAASQAAAGNLQSWQTTAMQFAAALEVLT
jgi:glycosyltransferase involved in cell wall biosynthesis